MCSKVSKKFVISILLNSLIVMFGIVGAILSFRTYGWRVFEFYTENSNYLGLVVSLIYCVAAVVALYNNKKVARVIYVLRFISTLCLTITLVVVVTLLAPLMPNKFNELMLRDVGLYYHLICPLLSLISFLFFEREVKLYKKDFYLALIPTIVYGVIVILLNLFKVITGPYPFLYLYEFKWYQTTLCLLAILLCAILLDFALFYLKNKKCYSVKRQFNREKFEDV